MTVNARWRSRRSRSRAAVHIPDFDILVPAPELSLPIQFCRHISKRIIFLHPRATALEGNESVENSVRERQLWSGNVGFFTLRSPSYTYIYEYICIYITYIHVYIYINIYSIDETTASQLDFLLNYIYICVCVEQNYLNFSCNNTFIVEIQRQTGRGNKKMK